MLKIAFVHNYFPAGGAERITADIARYLEDSGGYKVYAYAHHCNPEASCPGLTIRTIPSQAIQKRRSRAIERLIVSDGIDILVEVTKSVCDIEGIKARTGVKVVFACHGEVFWQRHSIMYHRRRNPIMWNLFYRRRYEDGSLAEDMAEARTWRDYSTCDAYTVLCEGYKEKLERRFNIEKSRSKVHVIENTEPAVDNVNLDKSKVALFCGRMENWSKRIDSVLRIWKLAELQDWTLKIVGGGRDGKWLQAYAEELELDNVEFVGPVGDTAPYYDEASVVMLASRTEGWPLVLTEAMARGCICTAFACSDGVKCLLDYRELSQFCFECRDEMAYAAKLREIASYDNETLLRFRKLNMESVARFTPDAVLPKWKELFDSLSGQ